MSDFYSKGTDTIYQGGVNFVNDTISVLLVDLTQYTPNLITDEYQSDIPSEAVLAERTLVGKSFTDGVFDASPVTFESVPSGGEVSGLVLIKDSGARNTSPLLLLMDDAPQFPITPDGSDITINWSSGPDKIFRT